MSDYVEVGGVRVTQDVLSQAYAWLVAHGCAYVPEGMTPSLTNFRHPDSTTSSPEEYMYLIFANPEIAPKGFRAAFIDPPAAMPSSPVAALKAAGFPSIVAIRAPQAMTRRNRQVEAWAKAQCGELAPWLWVKGGRDSDRTMVLARAAFMAKDAMRGQIVYKLVRDLCEEVNSADMYGENSKHNRLAPYRSCALLILDGMGEERTGAKELDTIYQIVVARWRDLLPTAFASGVGLSAWVRAYTAIDRAHSRDLASKVVEGLSGFAQGLSKAEVSEAASAHVIDLDGMTGGA